MRDVYNRSHFVCQHLVVAHQRHQNTQQGTGAGDVILDGLEVFRLRNKQSLGNKRNIY